MEKHRKTRGHVDKKKVKHHRAKRKEKKKSSKLSLFKHKVAGIFKEIVESPPEPIKEKPVEVTEQSESQFEPPEHAIVEPIVEEEPESEIVEKENIHDAMHAEILDKLNQSVSKWKETGEVGLHLEPPPKSFREKFKLFLARFKRSHVSEDLKKKIEKVVEEVKPKAVVKPIQMKQPKIDEKIAEKKQPTEKIIEKPRINVVEKARSKVMENIKPMAMKAKAKVGNILPTVKKMTDAAKDNIMPAVKNVIKKVSPDTEKIVRQEWKEIVEKVESASRSDREEVEKIYKQLSGK